MWLTLRDCYAGEQRIKQQGEIYLRRLSAHSQEEYESYLNRGYFYNAVRRTHVGLVGSLFRKPPEFTIPPSIKIDVTNITIQKDSLVNFSKTVGHEVLLTGRYGVLVDFMGSNAKDAYITGYNAENIYYWREIVWGPRKVIDRIILIENETVQTEYGETCQEIYRVLRLDPDANGNLLYSQDVIRPAADGKETPTVQKINFNSRGKSLDYIPFVFFNSTDNLPEAKPATLQDIATINISHYQSSAHLEHGRFYAGMPTYVTSGDVSEQIPGLGSPLPRTVGPSNLWELEKDAKAWLLEFTGHGLTFLENAVDSKQLQMQSLGGRLISSTRRAAAMSSEAWQLLETGDEATLLDVAETMDAGFARVLSILAHIRGDISDPDKSGIVAEFNKEFVRSDLTARELRALQALREGGHIPEDVMYYALRSVNVIPIEYTLEEFKALMDKKDQKYEPPTPPPMAINPNLSPPPKNPASNPKGGSFGGGN